MLAADRTRGRHVIAGVLGCPVCEAEYAVVDGAVQFAAMHFGRPPIDAPLLHLAAMMGLERSGGVVLVGGGWSAHAAGVSEIGEALVVVVNPASAPLVESERVSIVYTDRVLPVAARALRAAAVDADTAALDGIVAALAARGRYVAPVAVPVPARIAEIARDDAFWVGEAIGDASGPVPLGRARR